MRPTDSDDRVVRKLLCIIAFKLIIWRIGMMPRYDKIIAWAVLATTVLILLAAGTLGY